MELPKKQSSSLDVENSNNDLNLLIYKVEIQKKLNFFNSIILEIKLSLFK